MLDLIVHTTDRKLVCVRFVRYPAASTDMATARHAARIAYDRGYAPRTAWFRRVTERLSFPMLARIAREDFDAILVDYSRPGVLK